MDDRRGMDFTNDQPCNTRPLQTEFFTITLECQASTTYNIQYILTDNRVFFYMNDDVSVYPEPGCQGIMCNCA